EVELTETTCDDLLTAAEPLVAYQFGLSAGNLWAIQPTQLQTFDDFLRWWGSNRESFTADSLRQAAAKLSRQPSITQQAAAGWLLSFASMLPSSTDMEAVGMFLDGWRWGAKAG